MSIVAAAIVAVVTRPIARVGRATGRTAVIAGAGAIAVVVSVKVAIETVLRNTDSSVDPQTTSTGAVAGSILTANSLGRCQTVALGIFTGGGVGATTAAIADTAVATIVFDVGAGIIVLASARIS